jgi:nitrous oxidase accessory protein NosD
MPCIPPQASLSWQREFIYCSSTQNEEEGLGIQNLRYGVAYMPSVELVRFRRNPPVHSCVGGRLTIAGPYYPFCRR